MFVFCLFLLGLLSINHWQKRLIILFLTVILPLNGAKAADFTACSLTLPPQTMPNEKNKPDGYASEVLLGVSTVLGWSVRVWYMSWLRVVHEAKAGRCDIVYTVLRRNDYEQLFIFPEEPVLDQTNVLLTLRHSNIEFNGNLESFMRLYTVGLYQDKALDDNFESLRRKPWAKIQISVNAVQNLNMLLRNRIDAALENDMTAIYELRKLGQLDQVRILKPNLNTVPAYIVFPINGRLSADVDKFNKALKEFKKKNRLEFYSKSILAWNRTFNNFF